MKWRRLAWTTCVTGMISISSAAPAAQPPQTPPGEGVLCMLALLSIANQVGLACHPGEAPEYQAALQSSVDRLEDYVVTNGGGSRSDLERFLREQGGAGAPKTRLCTGDAASFYDAFRKGGAQRLREATDQMVSRPGKPTWGTCV
jgi:hypothetical protein